MNIKRCIAADAGWGTTILRRIPDRYEAGNYSGILVRPVRDLSELDTVYRLTHDAYLARGYITPQPDGRLRHYPHLDQIPETVTLVALHGGRIVGTNSLTLDGPRGLHVDEDFKTECDIVRRDGLILAGSWRIVTAAGSHNDRRIVMALIQETTHLVLRSGIGAVVFTFNPCHERIYARLLGMTTRARRDETCGLNNAPAVFMHLYARNLPSTRIGKMLKQRTETIPSEVSHETLQTMSAA